MSGGSAWRFILGKHATRLSRTPGTHTISMSPDCEYYLDSESSLTAPPRRTLHAKDGKQTAVYMEADRTATDEPRGLPGATLPAGSS